MWCSPPHEHSGEVQFRSLGGFRHEAPLPSGGKMDRPRGPSLLFPREISYNNQFFLQALAYSATKETTCFLLEIGGRFKNVIIRLTASSVNPPSPAGSRLLILLFNQPKARTHLTMPVSHEQGAILDPQLAPNLPDQSSKGTTVSFLPWG